MFSFILGIILGGVAGVICTSLLQKPVDNFKEKYTRILVGAINKRKPKFVPFHFAFGPIETTAIVMDGNAEEVYLKENIHCHLNPVSVSLPKELEDIKNNILLIHEENKRSGKNYMWNGMTYGLTKYTRSRTIDDERLELNLWFQPSDWYSHCATGLSLDTAKLISQNSEDEITLREKYLHSIDWSNPGLQPIEHFANTFSVVMCLITADNNLLLVQRSDEVVNPNQFNVSVNETLQRPIDRGIGNAPDLYRTVIRGTNEEMGFEPEEKDINFFSLCADSENCCWGIQGFIKTDKTAKEIIDFRRNRAKDKYESRKVIIVDFDINSVVKFVLNNGPWVGGSPACIYYTLTHVYNKKAVDDAIRKYQ